MALENSHPLDSPEDHSSLLNVLGWIFMTFATLIYLTRIGIKLAISKRLNLDDLLITIAMALAIAQTTLLSVAVSYEYGRVNRDSLTDEELEGQEKSIYAFNMLFFLSLTFSMESVVVLLKDLTPIFWHQRTCNAMIAAIGVWSLVTVLGLAFQCDLPDAWRARDNSCISRLSFYAFVEVTNILLEFGLILLPAAITINLRIRSKHKAIVIVCFCGRILVIATLVVQLLVIFSEEHEPYLFLSWSYGLTTSLALSLSIMSACVFYLRPIVVALNTGQLTNDDLRGRCLSEPESYCSRSVLNTARTPRAPSWHETILAGRVSSEGEKTATSYCDTGDRDHQVIIRDWSSVSIDMRNLRHDHSSEDIKEIPSSR